MNKSNPQRTSLVCILVVLVMVVYVFITDDGSSAPADSTPNVSVEAPAETETKEPTDPTPAIIGGVAAIGVYYLGSVAVNALKKGKRDKKDN